MSVYVVAADESDFVDDDQPYAAAGDHAPLLPAYWDMQTAFNAARTQAEFTGRAARVFKLTEIGMFKSGAKK